MAGQQAVSAQFLWKINTIPSDAAILHIDFIGLSNLFEKQSELGCNYLSKDLIGIKISVYMPLYKRTFVLTPMSTTSGAIFSCKLDTPLVVQENIDPLEVQIKIDPTEDYIFSRSAGSKYCKIVFRTKENSYTKEDIINIMPGQLEHLDILLSTFVPYKSVANASITFMDTYKNIIQKHLDISFTLEAVCVNDNTSSGQWLSWELSQINKQPMSLNNIVFTHNGMHKLLAIEKNTKQIYNSNVCIYDQDIKKGLELQWYVWIVLDSVSDLQYLHAHTSMMGLGLNNIIISVSKKHSQKGNTTSTHVEELICNDIANCSNTVMYAVTHQETDLVTSIYSAQNRMNDNRDGINTNLYRSNHYKFHNLLNKIITGIYLDHKMSIEEIATLIKNVKATILITQHKITIQYLNLQVLPIITKLWHKGIFVHLIASNKFNNIYMPKYFGQVCYNGIICKSSTNMKQPGPHMDIISTYLSNTNKITLFFSVAKMQGYTPIISLAQKPGIKFSRHIQISLYSPQIINKVILYRGDRKSPLFVVQTFYPNDKWLIVNYDDSVVLTYSETEPEQDQGAPADTNINNFVTYYFLYVEGENDSVLISSPIWIVE